MVTRAHGGAKSWRRYAYGLRLLLMRLSVLHTVQRVSVVWRFRRGYVGETSADQLAAKLNRAGKLAGCGTQSMLKWGRSSPRSIGKVKRILI